MSGLLKAIKPSILAYGVGNSEEVLSTLAATAKREKPLVIECDQERKTTETVTHWLTAIRS